MKTNYFYFLENFIGSKEIESKIRELRNQPLLKESNYYKANQITNPVLIAFEKSLPQGQTKFDFNPVLLTKHWLFIKFTANLIKYLLPEIEKNQNFKKELIDDLLRQNYGPFISIFNELVAAGFLKYLGFQIALNSSREKGKPDIFTIAPRKLVNDAKLFDNYKFRLRESLNNPKVQKIIFDFLAKCSNENILVLVLNFEDFNSELALFCQQYLKDKKPVVGKSIVIVKNSFNPSGAYSVDYQPTHSSISFNPNFDMCGPVEKLRESLIKIEKQFNGKPGIAWVSFSDFTESDAERRLIHQLTKIPIEFSQKHTAFISYEFFPIFVKGKPSIAYSLDIESNDNKLKKMISKESFWKFIKNIIDKPVLLIS